MFIHLCVLCSSFQPGCAWRARYGPSGQCQLSTSCKNRQGQQPTPGWRLHVKRQDWQSWAGSCAAAKFPFASQWSNHPPNTLCYSAAAYAIAGSSNPGRSSWCCAQDCSSFDSQAQACPVVTACAGISIAGSSNFPAVNGCYLTRGDIVDGAPSYINGGANILHWHGGSSRWWIGMSTDHSGQGFIAYAPGTQAGGPVAIKPSQWVTYRFGYGSTTSGWDSESLAVTGGASLCVVAEPAPERVP